MPSLPPPDLVIRPRDEVLGDARYPELREMVEREYQSNHDYRDEIDRTILTFLQRRVKVDPESCLITHFHKCRNYLLEECPAIMPLWAEQGYNFIVYPQPMTAAMAATHHRVVAKKKMDKANWLSLRFKRTGGSSATNHPIN